MNTISRPTSLNVRLPGSAKHNSKSENTTTKQKTQWKIRKTQRQIRKHNTLTKMEKVGTLGRHESSLIVLVRPLKRKDMVYMFSKQERCQ